MNPQTNLLRECARRTPIYRESTAELVVGCAAFALLMLMIVFI